MHNRARLIVASFLTKTLHLDWRPGAAHFASLLCDADVANNVGNWQWVAGTGNDTRPNRVLNPLRQARRFDPDGEYVRRYVPELAGVAGGAVHEPWRLPPPAPAARYPPPIVDHDGRARAARPPRAVSEQIAIRGETIRLGQLLKLAGVVDSGAEARELLAARPVLVNGEPETRSGRQLHPGDVVELDGRELLVTAEPDRAEGPSSATPPGSLPTSHRTSRRADPGPALADAGFDDRLPRRRRAAAVGLGGDHHGLHALEAARHADRRRARGADA